MLLLFVSCLVRATSIVYNIRIAEITKRQASSLKNSVPHIAVFTLFDQTRERYDCMHENIFGGMGSLIYLNTSMYAKMDIGAGHVRQCRDDFYFARTQSDDILFSAGYGAQIKERTKVTISGLLGLPTHKDSSFLAIQFGTGHVGFGIQLDGSYRFRSQKHKHSLLAAARLIHFLPRNVWYANKTNNLCFPFRFNIGNLTDFLLVYGCRLRKHGIEVGYNASLISNATLQPFVYSIYEQLMNLRNTVYAGYQYVMKTKHHRTGISFGLSYGKDYHPKLLSMKNVFSLWGVWGINF
jgi:hypothetical protein